MKNSIANSPPTQGNIPPGYLNIMGDINESQVNGPGCRAVVWVQEGLSKYKQHPVAARSEGLSPHYQPV